MKLPFSSIFPAPRALPSVKSGDETIYLALGTPQTIALQCGGSFAHGWGAWGVRYSIEGRRGVLFGKKRLFRGGVERSPFSTVRFDPQVLGYSGMNCTGRNQKVPHFFSTVRTDPQVLGYSGTNCTDLAGI